MSKVPVVTIDTDYVNRFLGQHYMSGAEFGRKLGYSDNWWSGVLKKKHVKPNVARLMCDMFLLEYDELVVKAPAPIEKNETLTVDGEVVEAFGKWLARIESKLDKLLSV